MNDEYEPSTLVAYFDGLCLPTNPGGYACGGWYIPEQPARPHRAQITGGRCYRHGDGATNNAAEYQAAHDALAAILRAGYAGPVLLRGDSNLVVEQFNENFRCKTPTLKVFLQELRDIAALLSAVTLEWIPREKNTMADKLSRNAFREATGGLVV